jgi:hypothetical protein
MNSLYERAKERNKEKIGINVLKLEKILISVYPV